MQINNTIGYFYKSMVLILFHQLQLTQKKYRFSRTRETELYMPYITICPKNSFRREIYGFKARGQLLISNVPFRKTVFS
jgi:hypothetical protein